MAAPSQASEAQREAGLTEEAAPVRPSTPQEPGLPDSSQVTLPSTEVPQSPIDPTASFKTELNDERAPATVIPSSLTPPPSTQVVAQNGASRRGFSYSQQSNLASPPATIQNAMRERDAGSDFLPPTPRQVLDATADELRAMLQTCIADHQKLKTETAHYKLQYNLLSLQSEEDAKRAAVEHDMIRREVDALRQGEGTRQAKRELSAATEASHAKYVQMKAWFEESMDDCETLHRRVASAKKVIQQKEEENLTLKEENTLLLNRIRENREHFRMLCSPGGMYHGASTPKMPAASTPQQYRSTPRQAPKAQQDRSGGREHGLSALLQAIGQDNSAPSTPMATYRAAPRGGPKHTRNAQSMSSLPTTPIHRSRGEHASLLPSVDLVPQTEPPRRYAQNQFAPQTPTSKPDRRRKSRESTISEDDDAELMRQAMQSVAAVQSFASNASKTAGPQGRGGKEDGDVFDSQASQAATEMLRRDPRQSFEVRSSAGSRDGSPRPLDESARMQAKMYSASNAASAADKRKFSGNHEVADEVMRGQQASPTKKARGDQRVGLGISH